MNDVTSKFGKILKQVQDDMFGERFSQKKGFTLAEVLITLGVIGVVAAITIPTLMNNTNDKELDTAKTTMNAKILEGLNQMRVNDAHTGYNTSEEFANALKKYMKVTQVCSNSDI